VSKIFALSGKGEKRVGRETKRVSRLAISKKSACRGLASNGRTKSGHPQLGDHANLPILGPGEKKLLQRQGREGITREVTEKAAY